METRAECKAECAVHCGPQVGVPQATWPPLPFLVTPVPQRPGAESHLAHISGVLPSLLKESLGALTE